jgi:hypothetical protein
MGAVDAKEKRMRQLPARTYLDAPLTASGMTGAIGVAARKHVAKALFRELALGRFKKHMEAISVMGPRMMRKAVSYHPAQSTAFWGTGPTGHRVRYLVAMVPKNVFGKKYSKASMVGGASLLQCMSR